MRRAVDRVVILVVDPLDDVSLLSDPGVWENAVGRSEILQVGFKRTDEGSRAARDVFPQSKRRRDLLHVIDSRDFSDPHAHRVA